MTTGCIDSLVSKLHAVQFRENVFCVFAATVRRSPIYRYRSSSKRRLALNRHKATINYSYVSPTLATVGLLRFGIIAGGRRYLSIDRILRLNNCALAPRREFACVSDRLSWAYQLVITERHIWRVRDFRAMPLAILICPSNRSSLSTFLSNYYFMQVARLTRWMDFVK